MGQALSAEGRAQIYEEAYRDVYSPLKLHVVFEKDYDEEKARKLTSCIMGNRTTLKTIKLVIKDPSCEQMETYNRYLETALNALVESTRMGRNELALETICIYGQFELNQDMLTKLLWVAPKHLELTLNLFFQRDAPTNFVGTDWSSCPLEHLHVECQCYMNNDGFVTLLNILSRFTSLKKVLLRMDTENWDMELFDASTATEPFISLLANNTNLEELRVNKLIPEQDLFCEQLAKCKKLKVLELSSLDGEPEHDGYLKALATVFRENPFLPICDFKFEDSGCEYKAWGPHGIHYYTTLNRNGCRQKLRNNSFTGEELVSLLAVYCQQSAWQNLSSKAACVSRVADNIMVEGHESEKDILERQRLTRQMLDDGLDAGFVEREMIRLKRANEERDRNSRKFHLSELLSCLYMLRNNWATSEEEQQLKDAGMLYGLLRESPGVWSQMAINKLLLEDTKPAARTFKRTSSGTAGNAKRPKISQKEV